MKLLEYGTYFRVYIPMYFNAYVCIYVGRYVRIYVGALVYYRIYILKVCAS